MTSTVDSFHASKYRLWNSFPDLSVGLLIRLNIGSYSLFLTVILTVDCFFFYRSYFCSLFSAVSSTVDWFFILKTVYCTL